MTAGRAGFLAVGSIPVALRLSIQGRRQGVDSAYATAGLLISSATGAYVLLLLGVMLAMSVYM